MRRGPEATRLRRAERAGTRRSVRSRMSAINRSAPANTAPWVGRQPDGRHAEGDGGGERTARSDHAEMTDQHFAGLNAGGHETLVARVGAGETNSPARPAHTQQQQLRGEPAIDPAGVGVLTAAGRMDT